MVVENLRLPSSNVKSGASPLRRTPSTNRQSPDDAAWTSLIDGTTLSGWGKHGGNATFRADGEMIVGTTGSGNSSTYLTCGSYADFALEFEVLCDKPLNAGVLIRSHRDTSSAKSSQPNQWERVFGYECEITQAERGRSGNFYDYFRRNRLLDDLSQKPGAAKAYSDYEWNHFRIVAQGDHIRSWVNGVACADFRDPWDSIGFISLQIHGTGPGEGPFQVRWKNIRIRELKTGELAPPLTPAPHGVPSANDGFVTIFDGKSLAGWQTAKENLGSFQVRDGAIVANGPRCHLYYVGDGRPFKNFHFACEVMTKRNSNGGIYFHTKYQDTQNPTQGLECQINNSTPDQKTGSLYGIATVTPTPASDDEWFKCEVIVDGKHVVIKIRDKVTVDYVEPVSGAGRRLGEGTFALQAIVEGSTVYYRNIRVKRLP